VTPALRDHMRRNAAAELHRATTAHTEALICLWDIEHTFCVGDQVEGGGLHGAVTAVQGDLVQVCGAWLHRTTVDLLR
jgi:hypothetical protein